MGLIALHCGTTPAPLHSRQDKFKSEIDAPLPSQTEQVALGSLTVMTPLPMQAVQFNLVWGWIPLPPQKAHFTNGCFTFTFPLPPQTEHTEFSDRIPKGSIPVPLQKAHLISFVRHWCLFSTAIFSPFSRSQKQLFSIIYESTLKRLLGINLDFIVHAMNCPDIYVGEQNLTLIFGALAPFLELTHILFV